jgi:hypothetical protein
MCGGGCEERNKLYIFGVRDCRKCFYANGQVYPLNRAYNDAVVF